MERVIASPTARSVVGTANGMPMIARATAANRRSVARSPPVTEASRKHPADPAAGASHQIVGVRGSKVGLAAAIPRAANQPCPAARAETSAAHPTKPTISSHQGRDRSPGNTVSATPGR